jgi:hypothetical protein
LSAPALKQGFRAVERVNKDGLKDF